MFSKEEIINEVRKWSEENGGRTPSEKIIREELKIPKWDWITYWTKVTDFQRDAGLTPHIFDNTKYTKSDLCNLFVKLIREIGKWPGRDQLDYKRRQDPKFPASVTFYKQLGLTGDLAQSILEYIKDKKDHEDIVSICRIIIEKYKNKSESSENSDIEKGYVYLGLQHGDYKIGHTKDLNRRREDITLLGSEPIKWVHDIETDDMKGVEEYWHKRFESKLLRGEWYKLNPSDIKAFKRWKKIF
jgi:hypothetical protein